MKVKIRTTKVVLFRFGCTRKKSPEGFRLPGLYQVTKSSMIV